MTHSHQFEDSREFIFEDVLVAEMLICDEQHCDYLKPIQYEVDFHSFIRDGEELQAGEAEEIWNRICEVYGTTVEPKSERWQSDAVEIQTRSGGQVTFYYDNSYRVEAVQLHLDNSTVRFDVDFYRELDPRKQ